MKEYEFKLKSWCKPEEVEGIQKVFDEGTTSAWNNENGVPELIIFYNGNSTFFDKETFLFFQNSTPEQREELKLVARISNKKKELAELEEELNKIKNIN